MTKRNNYLQIFIDIIEHFFSTLIVCAYHSLVQSIRLLDSITFFDSDTETTMEFGEEFEGRGSRVKVKTMRASKETGNTNIEKVLREADEEILRNKRRYPECLSAIMFIGDGDANGGATGAELKALVDEIKQRHITTAYALGAQGRALKKYFGEEGGHFLFSA